MSATLPTGSTLPLEAALDSLVSRGTISPEQRAAILAEVGGRTDTPALRPLRRRGSEPPATAVR